MVEGRLPAEFARQDAIQTEEVLLLVVKTLDF